MENKYKDIVIEVLQSSVDSMFAPNEQTAKEIYRTAEEHLKAFEQTGLNKDRWGISLKNCLQSDMTLFKVAQMLS